MAKLTVKDVDLKGKKVLVRVDFNVPVKDGVITNDNRITAALPTIKYILEQGGRAILFSHLGRVKEEADKEGKSLAPVAADLAAKLGQDVKFIPGVTRGAELEAAVNALEDGQVLLVENTRFEDVDGKKESKNDPELGKYWASLGDGIFVNDAFGTAHRAHASNVGISANVDKAVAGFLLENEIAYIKEAVETPERPFVAILGGSKVSDKIGVIENLLALRQLLAGGCELLDERQVSLLTGYLCLAHTIQNLRTFRIDIVCEKLGIYTRIRGIFLLVETLDEFQRNIGRVGKFLVAIHLQ